MWIAKLQDNYSSFDEWEAYSDMYGLAIRLGFNSSEEAWEANPTIQGSVYPEDFRVISGGSNQEEIRVCKDCNGSGRIVLFTSVRDCACRKVSLCSNYEDD